MNYARFSRQTILEQIGRAGQDRLQQARVLCVGLGGLGSPVASYLASCGVGTLGIADFDVVEESNLHRQVLHGEQDVGRDKVASAIETLQALNSDTQLLPFRERLQASNILEVLDQGFDIVVDGTDNFSTRYLLNDACVIRKIPNVHAAVYKFEGQVSVFATANGPCYRCVFPTAPKDVPNCAEAGVLGVLPGIIGTLQALEAINLIVGFREPLIGRMLRFDALSMQMDTLKFDKDADCAVCGKFPTITRPFDLEVACMSMASSISVSQLADRINQGNKPLLVDVREAQELEISKLAYDLHVPMNEIPGRMTELDRESEVVFYCRSGVRSGQVCDFLASQGFTNVHNLVGGINAWAIEIDPSLPTY